MPGPPPVTAAMYAHALLAVLSLAVAVRSQAATEQPRFVPPRTAADAELAPAMKTLRELLDKGVDGQALLAAKELQGLREVAEFRKAVAERAPTGEVVLTVAGEPGTPLVVRGKVADDTGKPLAGALLYAYHTSAKGWYSDRAPHIASSGNAGGDFGHARLFGYVRTDARGDFVLRTVRPGGYPQSTLPEHIHWQVWVDGKSVAVGELWFDDDARLTKAMRERAGRDVVIAKPERSREGEGLIVQATLVIDAARLPAKK